MREHDETPYIVIEREGGGGLGSFVLGALVGAGLALLFAPQSGEETQEEIKTRALKFKDAARDRVREAQSNLEGRLNTLRITPDTKEVFLKHECIYLLSEPGEHEMLLVQLPEGEQRFITLEKNGHSSGEERPSPAPAEIPLAGD